MTALPDDLLSAWNEPALEAIVRAGSLDARTAQGATGLWHAVYFGRPAWALRLLAAGASPGAHDVAAIDRALGHRHFSEHWTGLPEGAPATPSGRGTLLHTAASRGAPADVLRALVGAGVAVDGRERFGATALHYAARHHDVAAIEGLCALGADANAADRAGHTPLDYASLDLAVIRLLLARGARPDGAARVPWPHATLGWGALSNAALYGRLDVVDALLDAGADLTKHPEALAAAARGDHAAVVRRLLDAGADARVPMAWGGRSVGPLESAAECASTRCVRLLLAPCADALDRALRLAVEGAPGDSSTAPNDRRADRQETVLALLDAGAHASEALPSTGWHGDAWYATTLLARGADPDARDEHGRTALHVAASRGSVEVARALLAHGADAHLRSPMGESPYELAQHAWRVERVDDARLVMQCLDAAGAGAPPDPPPPRPPRTGFEEGSTVRHGKFGEGVVRAVSGVGEEMKLTIDFPAVGQKTLLARFVTAG